ncbi:MAG: 30S ribosomal protein S6, partial [Ruminococcus bromii]
YVLFDFESEAEFPAELDRIYKITEGVMRSMIIKKEVE